MARLKGKSGPPGNMNAFKHGRPSIQKRRLNFISSYPGDLGTAKYLANQLLVIVLIRWGSLNS
jgi:hypothetical protein